MEYLPAEIQLKILQNLNFDELFKIKQTSRHYYNFINKYEGSLAQKRFESLYIITDAHLENWRINLLSYSHMRDIPNDDILSNKFQEKWQSAMDKQIPVFIKNRELPALEIGSISENEPLFSFVKDGSDKKNFYLKLPLFPQNIEEFKIIRFWLEQIFRCVFGFIKIWDCMFNPKMIELLFDNEEIKKLKFNCQKASIFFLKQNIDAWKFNFDCLVISEFLNITFSFEGIQRTTTEEENILLELLLNEGQRIPEVILTRPNNIKVVLYNNLINYLETSTDLSKMVVKIKFYCEEWPRSQLIIKGDEMSENNNKEKCYKITNIHNSKMMFSILWIFKKKRNNLIKSIEIVRILN